VRRRWAAREHPGQCERKHDGPAAQRLQLHLFRMAERI